MEEVLKKFGELGWEFQEPYTLCLQMIVTRRRRGMNPTQILFWMSEATDEQKKEAMEDAMEIIAVRRS